MAIKLNSLPSTVFDVKPEEMSGSRERADIVACGRLLMAERNGRDTNALRILEKKPAEYTARLDENSYAATNENTKRKMMLFAAKMAAAQTGEDAPATYEEFQRMQRRYLSDKLFLKVLSGIIRDIVTPVLPAVFSNALDWLCETVSVPLGQTYEIDVASNDFFVFDDDSWGASRSKPSQTLYAHTITLNPRPRTAKATIKWYQLVGNGADLGAFFNAIAAGMYNKIVALWNKAMIAGVSNSFFMPTGLVFTGLSNPNWVSALKAVAMSNNTSIRNIVAFGDITDLSQVLPTGNVNAASVNLDAALSTMLGAEYIRYGYLGEFMGARLMPIDDVIFPGTQNDSVEGILTTGAIFFAAINGYKPVYLGMEDGTPIQIELSPSETADMTIDIITTVSLEAKPVMASKIGVMSL